MGLLSGSASLTRFTITERPEEPDFDALRFEPLLGTSERRESVGFLPFEIDAPYRVGHDRFAFRVRIDKLRPDPTAVAERFKELVRDELAATGLQYLGSRKRRELRELAAEELVHRTAPRAKVIEGCLDGTTLWLGTTAKAHLGSLLLLLRQLGVSADFRAPWLEEGEDEPQHPFFEVREPGQSVWGCRFLRALVEEGDVLVEPLAGSVRLQTREAKVTLSGAVIPELLRFVDEGAELLSARLVAGDHRFRLEASTFRVNGLSVETARHDHWTELLDERLEKISALFELLDAKYRELRPRMTDAETPVPVEDEPEG
ncbi:MAG: hypothetical protein IPJ17_08225 [Holophagales bacterium]|nr:MAG: hypothetical protein IPJ17_08225 [Holophagales bacterium]